MRKIIIATAALAFLSSSALSTSAFAQDKGTAAPAASGDSMSKSEMSKTKKSKKSKKSSMKSGDDSSMSKQ
jgi:hypothetical protein